MSIIGLFAWGWTVNVFTTQSAYRKQHEIRLMAELLSLREAVERFVQDGDTVALEGFTHLIPTAAAHEIVRQGRKDLTLVRMTPDLVYDLLIGAGCAKKLIWRPCPACARTSP